MSRTEAQDVPRKPGSVTPHTGSWRGAIRQRPAFRTLLIGQALGELGDGFTQISFAQLVVFDIGRGATPGRIAFVFAVTMLPFSVVGPLAGILIDRWDRRRTLVVASVCRAALAAIAVLAAVWRSEPLAYVGVVLLLSSSRFVLDAKSAVLPRTVPADDLVRSNAVSSLLGMSAAFTGAISGALFVSWSAVAGFVAGAGAYLAAGAWFRRLPAVGGAGDAVGTVTEALRRLGAEFRAGTRAIARTPELNRPLTAVWLHRLLLGAGFVLLVLEADQRYHLETSGYALAIAVTGVAAVAGTLAAPWLSARWPSMALLPLAFVPPAAVAGAVGYGPTLPGLVCTVVAGAVAFQALKILTDALVGANARDAVRGRVFSIYDVLYNVAFVLAGLAMIPVWHAGDETALLWWLGAAFAAGWLLTARLVHAWPFTGRRTAARRRWGPRAAALLAGAAVVVVFPAPSLWWASWVALVPWLVLIRRAPGAREAAVRGFCAAAGFLLAVHYWLLPSTTVFLPVIAAVLGLLWMPWAALSWWLLNGAVTARRLAAAVLVVPAGWVLVEAVRSWSALGGPWGLLGASQWRSPVFLAPAALGGVWLVSYLIVAVNVALAALVERPPRLVAVCAGLAAAGLLAVGPLAFVLQPPPRIGGGPTAAGPATARVAVVQVGVVRGAARRLAAGIAATERLPPGRYDLVVWGESSVGFDLFARPDLRRRLAAVAARRHTYLLVNVDARAVNGAIRKTAVLLDAHGIVASYQKTRLVPFGEYIPLRPVLGWLASFTRAAAVNRVHGHRIVVMHAGPLVFAPLICFESAFPDMSRTAVNDGARLLVFQTATTTFQGTWAPQQHAALAAVRAVETGRPVVQAALAGTSAAFDAEGRRLLWHPAATGSSIIAVPLAGRVTLFDRWGAWVPAGCLVAVAAAVVAVSLRQAGAAPRRAPPVEPRAPAVTRRTG